MKINTKSLLYGTIILTAANFGVRILGFVYRVFLSRIMGPEGMGLLQLIFPLYIMTITLSASGIPVAVSHYVAREKANAKQGSVRQIVSISALLVTVISIIISILLVWNVDFVASELLHDVRTRSAILIFFPCILITGLAAVLKGYFYGMNDIHPPALAEIIEQVFRMLLVTAIFMNITQLDIQTAVNIAIVGMVAGELAGLLCLQWFYRGKAKKTVRQADPITYLKVFKNIFLFAAPLTCTKFISSSIMATNTILIPQRLIAGGMESGQAMSTLGIVSGMAMPLLFLPFTITSALSVIIVPNLSESMAVKDLSQVRGKIAKSIYITCLTALISMAILIPLGFPVGYYIYGQADVGKYLVPLSFSLLFLCFDQTMGSILSGLGKQNLSALHSIIGDIVQLACTYFLVADPRIGVYGFILGFTINSLIVSVLNFIATFRITKLKIKFFEWVIKPGLAALFTGLTVRLAFLYLVERGLSGSLVLIIAVLMGLLMGIGVVLLIGNVSMIFTKSHKRLSYGTRGNV